MNGPARSLPRVLDAPAIAVLASASMGPAYSIATTMGPMVASAGTGAPLAFAVLSVLMLCIAVGFARLSQTRPNAGSSYGWTEAAFGRRVGAYGAWLLLLSNFFATMSTALPAGIYTLALLVPSLSASPLASAVVGTAWIVGSAVLLAAGLRPTAFVSAGFLITELVVLAIAAVAVAVHPGAHGDHAGLAAASGAQPGLLGFGGLGGFAGAMVLGIWMSDGWEVSASSAEETTSANASGRGGIAGLIVTTILLLGAMAAFMQLGSAAIAAHQTNVLDYVASRLGGRAWRIALAVTVLASTAATLWTTMLYLSRSIYAMGRSGVLPRPLGALDERGAPTLANSVVAASVGIATVATGFIPSLAVALQLVLNGTSVFLGLLFVLSVAAGIRLASARERISLGIVPAIGGAGLLAVVAITLWQTDAVTRTIALGGLALGVPFVLWRTSMRVVSAAAPSQR